MSGEWKPGDIQSLYGLVSLTYVGAGLWRKTRDPAKDLAIIDPDSPDVNRLVSLLGTANRGPISQVRAALREFARPTPSIEEPTGLGAVVEAIYDNRFIHVGGGRWQHEDAPGIDNEWRDIAAVRILSPGVES